MIGAGIGLVVNYVGQVNKNIQNGMSWGDALYYKNINGGAMAGAAISGAVFAAMMGIASPASVPGTAIWGATGGLVGGQTGRFVQATWEEVEHALSGNGWDAGRFLTRARDAGFLDTNAMIVDALSGEVGALVGKGLEDVLVGAGLLNHPSVVPQNHDVWMIQLGANGKGGYIYNATRQVYLPDEALWKLIGLLENGAYQMAVELISEYAQSSAADSLANLLEHAQNR